MSSSTVKGILRGFRYISQIFDNEKEKEIQIGNPTDVKHVAHIGWDGPSVNTPSWMNEFKSSPGFTSAPLNLNGELQNIGQNDSVKWVSEGIYYFIFHTSLMCEVTFKT
ncbi:putative CRIB domain-containing protein [Lupinus albus]|uniref:Putative CRIB domain-containing protein n=1 Tax=Lupinus albus TaxID=3870 RepID=A0A6A4QE47_LUPAL|nr:putative CRIB domain-containing protein [Lupinus albus]